MKVQIARFDSPIGRLTLVAEAGALIAVHLPGQAGGADVAAVAQDGGGVASPVLRAAVEQLGDYFAGRRTAFDLPLAPRGTAFQRAVWAELARIPYGTTTTYGELARVVGRPGAARAVGAANGQNPLAIVVPCHRVIGAGGALTGYGGGLPVKRWLLTHEATTVHAARPQSGDGRPGT